MVEFEKSWAFGLQKKNEVFELMMSKSKIGYSWLKKWSMNVGNRGLVSNIEGRVNLWKQPVNYSLTYKLKQIQNNFYEDSSLGFTLNCNV